MSLRTFSLALALIAASATAVRANSYDPCTLVTQAEASAAMGVAAQAGKEEHMSGGNACRYASADRKRNVYVHMIPVEHVAQAVQMGGTAVSGIGDKAYWLAGSIFVQKGSNAVQVALYLGPGSMNKMDPAEVTLAKQAASRM